MTTPLAEIRIMAEQLRVTGDIVADHRGPVTDPDLVANYEAAQTALRSLSDQARRLERLLRRAVVR